MLNRFFCIVCDRKSSFSTLARIPSGHQVAWSTLRKFLSLFGGHHISMNIPPTKRKDPKPTPYKWEGNYAYLCVRSLLILRSSCTKPSPSCTCGLFCGEIRIFEIFNLQSAIWIEAGIFRLASLTGSQPVLGRYKKCPWVSPGYPYLNTLTKIMITSSHSYEN